MEGSPRFSCNAINSFPKHSMVSMVSCERRYAARVTERWYQSPLRDKPSGGAWTLGIFC